MAHEKQGWKNALQALKPERGRQDDRVDQREQKKIATAHYKRRKLEKDVKTYTNNATRINSRIIDDIGRQHGFHVVGTQFREDPVSQEDAKILPG